MIVRSRELQFESLPGRRAADPFAGSTVDGLSMRVVELDAAAPRNPHYHPESFEVMYVAAGAGEVWEDGRMSPVGRGDCIAIPPRVPHATVPDEGTRMTLVCFFPHPDLAANTVELDEPQDVRAQRRGSK